MRDSEEYAIVPTDKAPATDHALAIREIGTTHGSRWCDSGHGAADGNAQISDENARSYSLRAGDETYLIHVSEVPTFALWLAPLALLYDRAKSHYIEENNVTETASDEVRRFGRTGRSLSFSPAPPGAGDGEGRVEFFLLENNMLVFEAVIPTGASRTNLKRFFASIGFDRRRE